MTITPNKIDELMGFIQRTAEGSKDFVLEQAPLVAREIVSWHVWNHGMWAGLLCITLIITLVLMRKCPGRMTKAWKQCDDGEGLVIPMFMGTMILISIPAIQGYMLYNNTSQMVKGLVAPRIVLIEYVAKQVK